MRAMCLARGEKPSKRRGGLMVLVDVLYGFHSSLLNRSPPFAKVLPSDALLGC